MLPKITRLIVIFACFLAATTSNAEDFSEGIDYKTIRSPFQTTAKKGQVEVIEIFWYGCPHCYNFKPIVKSWKRPTHIDYKHIPAYSKRGWGAIGAQLYYTAQALGMSDTFHDAIFEEIHEKGDKDLVKKVETAAEFFAKYGIKENKFYDTWNSFSVDSNLKSAKRIFERSSVDGVPSIIVAGKYLTSPSIAGGSRRALKIVEFLAKKELAQ